MTLEEAKVELEKFVKLKTTMRPAFVQPLLDAVEQKHGHWDNKQIGEDISTYGAPYTIARCSVCRGKVFVFAEDYLVNYPYCPLCGAKMDEVETDE